jgi:hypothetical protein
VETQTSFGGWYRAADFEPQDAILRLRWQGIENWANSLDCMSILDLARLFHKQPATRPDFEKQFRLDFHKIDTAFQMADNGLELAVLAGTTLARAIETGDQNTAIIAAFALICPDFAGTRKNAVVPDIICMARNYLKRTSENLRTTRATSQFDADAVRLDTETLKPLADAITGNQPSEVANQLLATFQRLGSTVQSALSRIGVLEEQHSLYREESDVLWWLTGGYTSDFDVPAADIPAPAACLIAGKELADLTRVLPGPRAASAFLDRFLQCAGKDNQGDVIFSQAINNANRQWRAKWASAFSNIASLDLCPVLFAVNESTRSEQSSAWQAVFKTQTQMAANLKVPAVQLAQQVYEECLFVRAVRAAASGGSDE